MKEYVLLIIALMAIGCLGGEETIEPQECEKECISMGYDEAKCGPTSIGTGAIVKTHACKSDECEGDCYCYCYKNGNTTQQCMEGPGCTKWCEEGIDTIIDNTYGKTGRKWNASDAPCCCKQNVTEFKDVNDWLKPHLGEQRTIVGEAKTNGGKYLETETGNKYCLFFKGEYPLGKKIVVVGRIEGRITDYGTCTGKSKCGTHLEYCINVKTLEEIS